MRIDDGCEDWESPLELELLPRVFQASSICRCQTYSLSNGMEEILASGFITPKKGRIAQILVVSVFPDDGGTMVMMTKLFEQPHFPMDVAGSAVVDFELNSGTSAGIAQCCSAFQLQLLSAHDGGAGFRACMPFIV